MSDDVKKGLLLSNALERHPGVFSSLYISLVKAGEVSGKLADTLDELSSYMETVEDTQRKVKSAMYYPVFIIGFLFFMMFITFTFIIPQFKSVYDQLGSELPYYTVLLVNISEWFQSNFFFISTLIFLGLVVLWLLSLTDSGRLTKDRVLLKTPIFGGLIEQGILSKFAKTFAARIPGTKNNTSFWSSGISVVLHPKNPKIPAMHFNTRFICTQKNWFGGGMDATPCLVDLKEKKFFHKELKKVCNVHSKKYYPKYKKWCDEYFYLPHRKETRGIGGIFFDYKMDNWEKDFLFIKDIGNAFSYLLKKIIEKKMFLKWSQKEKEIQLLKRSRYVEYNLLYDRGTKFGLNSGGNPEAILMSMPPNAKWK